MAGLTITTSLEALEPGMLPRVASAPAPKRAWNTELAVADHSIVGQLDRLLDRLAGEERVEGYRQIGLLLDPVEIARSCRLMNGLKALVYWDTLATRGLRSSLVVAVKTGLPGWGFFDVAREAGHQIEETWQAELDFAREQQRRAFQDARRGRAR